MRKLLLSLFLVLTLVGCSSKEKEPEPKIAEPQSGYQANRDYLKTKAEKRTYDAILDSILKFEKQTIIKDVTAHQVENIFAGIQADHPEVYYLEDDYNYTTDETYEETKVMTFQPKYRFTKKQVTDYNAKIDKACANVIKQAKTKKDDLDKIKILYDFILDRVEYVEESKENQNILSVFLYKKSVCAGYARSLQYLCSKVNIPCTYITGISNEYSGRTDFFEGRHAWNMIKLNGVYYYTDSTNADQFKTKDLRYSFLTMSEKQMDKMNEPDNRDVYQRTTSYKNSYFVRNKAYFTSVDDVKLKALIRSELNTGEPFRLVYQCKDENIAARIENILTKDSNLIFDMTGIDEFSYYEIPETGTYAFIPTGATA